jgi:hypothetical protein
MPHHPDDKRYPHLPLIREDRETHRRKPPPPPPVNLNRGGRGQFGPKMKAALNQLEAEARHQRPPVQGIHPHLVFRIPVAVGTSPTVLTDRLQELGIAVVSIENDGAIIAFRDDTDLSTFKDAVGKYERGPRLGVKSTKYDVFEIIEPDHMRLWSRTDRIGTRLANVIGKQGEVIDSNAYFYCHCF